MTSHYPQPYRPCERDLRLLDLYARQAADFIDRKRADEALRQSEARLAEENRHKDEYLAMLGHELRNPLAAIRNATELMKHAGTEDPRLRRACEVLERQSAHVARIIDGLLEVSRIALGKVDLILATLDARDVVDRVLQDNASVIAERGLELAKELAAEPLWISGDGIRLVQVFDNLIGNAIKFTSPPGSITVVVERDAASALVRVRDTGAGLRPAMLSRIFEPFQQEAQDVARSTGGLGLGLALARGLVNLHGGTIEAHSAGPGAGAEFVVRLPLVSPPSGEPCQEQAVAATPRRILIVEDNADAAQMLCDLLELRGHDVTMVATGPDALDFLHSRDTDIVLCDLGLPGMSGYDLARAIRDDPSLRAIPLVALTGYSQPHDRKQTEEAGFDGHLVKPVGIEALDDVLDRLGRGRIER